MAGRRVEIDLTAPPEVGKIRVDGVPVRGVRAFDISNEVGQPTRVTLELVMLNNLAVTVDDAEVTIPERAREGLIALGWTPPSVLPELARHVEVPRDALESSPPNIIDVLREGQAALDSLADRGQWHAMVGAAVSGPYRQAFYPDSPEDAVSVAVSVDP